MVEWWVGRVAIWHCMAWEYWDSRMVGGGVTWLWGCWDWWMVGWCACGGIGMAGWWGSGMDAQHYSGRVSCTWSGEVAGSSQSGGLRVCWGEEVAGVGVRVMDIRVVGVSGWILSQWVGVSQWVTVDGRCL